MYPVIKGNAAWFRTLFTLCNKDDLADMYTLIDDENENLYDLLRIDIPYRYIIYDMYQPLTTYDPETEKSITIPRDPSSPFEPDPTHIAFFNNQLNQRLEIFQLLLTTKTDINGYPAKFTIRRSAFDRLLRETGDKTVLQMTEMFHKWIRLWIATSGERLRPRSLARGLLWLARNDDWENFQTYHHLVRKYAADTWEWSGWIFAYWAAYYGKQQILADLLKEFYTKNYMQSGEYDINSVVFVAAEQGHYDMVVWLGETFSDVLPMCDKYRGNLCHAVAKNGHLNILTYLFSTYPTIMLKLVNQTRTNNVTPLYIACENNHLPIVQYLLAIPKVDLNVATENEGYTSLLIAAKHGHRDIVEELLKYYPGRLRDINQRDEDNCTDFLYACQYGNIDIVRRLLEIPATDLNITTKLNPILIRLGLGHDFLPDGSSCLTTAAWYGHDAVIAELLQHYPSRLKNINHRNVDGYNVFLSACCSKSIAILHQLQKIPGIDIHENDNTAKEKKINALNIAINRNHAATLDFLLSHYRDRTVDIPRLNDEKRLLFAVSLGNTEIVRTLCSTLDELDLNVIDENGDNGLQVACMMRYVEIVNIFLRYYPGRFRDVNYVNKASYSACMLAAERGRTDIVQRLCMCPEVDLRIQNKEGLNCLLLAARCGHSSVVDLLVTFHPNRININHISVHNGTTAIREAIIGRHISIVRSLCRIPSTDLGILENKEKWSLLMYAIHYYTDSTIADGIIDELLRYYPDRLPSINHRDRDGNTALIIACEYGRTSIVRKLCQIEETDLNNAANDGKTALLTCVDQRRTEALQELLRYHPHRLRNLTHCDKNGRTAANYLMNAELFGIAQVLFRASDDDWTANTGSTIRKDTHLKRRNVYY